MAKEKSLDLFDEELEVRAKKNKKDNLIPEACKDAKKKIKKTMLACGMPLGKKKPAGKKSQKPNGDKKIANSGKKRD